MSLCPRSLLILLYGGLLFQIIIVQSQEQEAILSSSIGITLFTVFLYPSLKAAIRARTYCQSSVQCGECDGNKMECHYYNDDMSVSEDTIMCDCETNE